MEPFFPPPPPSDHPPTAQPFGVPSYRAEPFVPYTPPARTYGLAIAALVCGIAGVFLFVLFAVLPMLALVFGLVSAAAIKRSGGRLRGLGMARAGWILGTLGIVGFGVFAWAVATERIETDIDPATTSIDVGDCVESLPPEGIVVVDDLDTVDCAVPHEAQVIAMGNLNPGSEPFPGDNEVAVLVEERCLEAFAEFVGMEYSQSVLEVFYVQPNELGWKIVDGEYTCMVYEPGKSVTGTLAGANR
ncbi:MAG: DUF4190 domain-containing protein [Actinomycetota bacterium]|nr:DUF4190 domain-containing protein [Actinomycetota bacterium]